MKFFLDNVEENNNNFFCLSCNIWHRENYMYDHISTLLSLKRKKVNIIRKQQHNKSFRLENNYYFHLSTNYWFRSRQQQHQWFDRYYTNFFYHLNQSSLPTNYYIRAKEENSRKLERRIFFGYHTLYYTKIV